MNTLSFDTGVVAFSVNGKCEVSFNPTDSAFVEKLFSAFEALDRKQEAYKDEISRMASNREIFELARKLDAEQREVVDGVFGAPVCGAVFEGMNVYAMAGGLPVWCNFMLAIMDEIDTTFAREQKATNPRMSAIKRVVVMGAGVMGPGIAQIMTMAGAEVCLYDIAPEALERAKVSLRRNYDTFVAEGMLEEHQAGTLFSKVSYATNLAEAIKEADLVLEAVAEREELKRTVYQQLDELLPPNVILASNTSALNIFELMPERRLPHTVIVHWYAPANVIPLVEVVGNGQTEERDIETVMELLRRGGKRPVRLKKFIRGYIVNRLQQCLNQEVFYLLDNGYCTPEDLDMAVRSSFIPRACVMGICKRIDFGGLDMTANNFRNHSYTMPPATDMPETLRQHVEKGELGVKTGKGFYDYTGIDMEALKAKQDRQLFDVFRLVNEFMNDPV